MKLQNLTKENFWNEIYQKYPDACKLFCDWIDKYKEENEWDDLFNDGYSKIVIVNKGRVDWIPPLTKAPKYHDLPYAMQMGIWIAFVQDQGSCSWEIDDMFEFDLQEEMNHWFASKQLEFDKHGNDL